MKPRAASAGAAAPGDAVVPAGAPPGPDPAARLDTVDWESVAARLDEDGYAILPSMLRPEECGSLAALYGREAPFRSRIVMAPRNFGRGEYKYFAYPLPPPVAALRTALYPPLAAIATDGTPPCASRAVIRPTTAPISNTATAPARPARPR